MQILFNDIVLAGEFEESTSDLSRDASTIVQMSEFLRGTEPTWNDRGNYRSSIRFSTMRIFNTIMDAELFFLEHGDNEGTKTVTELTGIVTFKCGDSPQATRYARGKLSINMPRPFGVSVVTQYQIEYGRLSKSKPTD